MVGQVETLLTGLGFPEGPAYMPDGTIAFVDLLCQSVSTYKNGEMKTVVRLEGAPNGMRLGPDGALYVANNGGVAPESLHSVRVMDNPIPGCIQRISLDGNVENVVFNLPGEGPWRPNDLTFSSDGQIVFSDPQNWEDVKEWTRNSRIPGYKGGRLFRATCNGDVSLLADCYGYPNGVAFHPDGSLLVGVTLYGCILKYPWYGDHVGRAEVWCQFKDGTAPDGILVHDETLYVAGSLGDKVAMVDMKGIHFQSIETGPGSDPTNLTIGDGRLWVTLGLPGKLVAIDL